MSKEMRRERNRITARESRDRKAAYVTQLESEVQRLNERVAQLEYQVATTGGGNDTSSSSSSFHACGYEDTTTTTDDGDASMLLLQLPSTCCQHQNHHHDNIINNNYPIDGEVLGGYFYPC